MMQRTQTTGYVLRAAYYLLLATCYLLLAPASRVRADNMKSASYYLQFGNFNITSGTKTSSSYTMTDTAGQTGAGFYGGSQDVKSGFQYIYPFATPPASPPASPSATPNASPSPSPFATPTGFPTPSPSPSPLASPTASPSALLTALEQAGLPPALVSLITTVLPVLENVAPIITMAAAVVETSFSFLPILFEVISRILQSIGLIPVKRPRGVVFDTKNGAGIAFVTITFIRVSDNQIIDTVVSDTSGVYRSIKLPPGIYRIEAVHSDYLFPTKLSPKFLVNPHDFYRGESFEIRKQNQEELFLIPMDPLFEESAKQETFYLQIFLSYLRRVVHNLFYPMVVFSAVITLLFPTTLNIAIIMLYVAMIVYRVYHTRHEPPLSGNIIDRQGRALPNVLLRFTETTTNQVSAISTTDEKGAFRMTLPPHQYMIVVNRDGYVVEQASHEYTNVFVAHTGREGTLTIRMMTVKEAFPESIQ